MSEKGMSRIGTVVTVVLAVAGLLAVAFFIFMGIALSRFGSNK
jgi:hypothetical protein